MRGLNLLIKSSPPPLPLKVSHKLNSTMTRRGVFCTKKQQIHSCGGFREPGPSILSIPSGREVKDILDPLDGDLLGECQVPLCQGLTSLIW